MTVKRQSRRTFVGGRRPVRSRGSAGWPTSALHRRGHPGSPGPRTAASCRGISFTCRALDSPVTAEPPSMRILEKTARVAAIVLAVLFIGLSLCGVVGAWFVIARPPMSR